MLVYIVAYFFYIDGVHTIISMATSYGTNLGLDSARYAAGAAAGPGAGPAFLPAVHEAGFQIRRPHHGGRGHLRLYVHSASSPSSWTACGSFWMLAVLLCATSQGGIQALSRSMFGKLIPDRDRSGEFFGFFDIFGKFSSILGAHRWWVWSALPLPSRMLA